MTTSLDGYRKVRLTTDFSLNTSPSLLDSYARKAIFETDFPGVSKRNFIEFASNYCPNKTGKKKGALPVVINNNNNNDNDNNNINNDSDSITVFPLKGGSSSVKIYIKIKK